MHIDGDATSAALAELLCRCCLGRSGDGEEGTALRLLRDMRAEGEDAVAFVLAAAGVWAGFMPDDERADEVVAAGARLARALLPSELDDTRRLLAAAVLALAARRGHSDRPGADLVAVAISAQRVEHHELGIWAAREALRRRDELDASQEAVARLMLAVLTACV